MAGKESVNRKPLCPRHVQAHPLRQHRLEGWADKIAGRWSYRQLAADPAWRDGWISFDSVVWNPSDGLVYCGLNSIDGDLLYSFDPKTSAFRCLDSRQWTDPFDAKIHRTLLLHPQDGCLYFATSLLHDADQQQEAPGGKVMRYNPATGHYQCLGIPLPHLYVQSIAADWDRKRIYGFSYPAEFLFELDLTTGVASNLAYVGNAILFAQPHNAVVDHQGWLWGTYAETRAWDEVTGTTPIRLFKYHPEGHRFVWFEHGLSRRDDSHQLIPFVPAPELAQGFVPETRHVEDYGFCDSMVYDGDQYIYAGTTAGVLSRIDTATGAVEKVTTVMASGRFPALGLRDGILYGGGGLQGYTQLVRLDVASGRIDSYTDLTDPTLGERPARVHELAVGPDHELYLAENDNHERSSYLWRVRLT